MQDIYFTDQCKGLTSIEILNLYRNLYYKEGVNTERGLVAAALNELLPIHSMLLNLQAENYYKKEGIKNDY